MGAALAVVWPDATTRIARFVGLGRGVNLLLYCTVVVMMAGFFMVYIRLRRVRQELTLLVRHLAILQAQEGRPRPRTPEPNETSSDTDVRRTGPEPTQP